MSERSGWQIRGAISAAREQLRAEAAAERREAAERRSRAVARIASTIAETHGLAPEHAHAVAERDYDAAAGDENARCLAILSFAFRADGTPLPYARNPQVMTILGRAISDGVSTKESITDEVLEAIAAGHSRKLSARLEMLRADEAMQATPGHGAIGADNRAQTVAAVLEAARRAGVLKRRADQEG